MLVTADWVLPISRPPIRNGALIIEHGQIVEVGRADELAGLDTSGERRDFGACVMLPGLVNAHTHLSLTAMQGLLEPGSFEDWLPQLVVAMQSWSAGDFAASAALGAHRCLEAGVTVVGDIVYGPESSAAASDAGLGGVFYWEVLGVEGPRLYAELERMEYPVVSSGSCGPRMRCGLSPHSAYTSGPGLLHAMHDAAREIGAPVAIHVAESGAEVQLLRDGSGPLAATAARMAKGFDPPGVGPVCYLDRLGVLDGCTAVHLGQMLPTDVPRIAATARGVVTCPRSNRFLANHLPPVSRLRRAGVPIGVGTDSSASNDDLDLLAELRVLQDEDPSLSAHDLLEMATAMGAIALGLEDRFGILETGMQADVAVFDVGPTNDPEADLVRRGGATSLRAVMAGGVWRVLDGAVIRDDRDFSASAHAASVKAREAIALT